MDNMCIVCINKIENYIPQFSSSLPSEQSALPSHLSSLATHLEPSLHGTFPSLQFMAKWNKNTNVNLNPV